MLCYIYNASRARSVHSPISVLFTIAPAFIIYGHWGRTFNLYFSINSLKLLFKLSIQSLSIQIGVPVLKWTSFWPILIHFLIHFWWVRIIIGRIFCYFDAECNWFSFIQFKFWYHCRNGPHFDPFCYIFDDFESKLVGNVVILTLDAIDSAFCNSNFGTSVEMNLILTHFDPFWSIFDDFRSKLVGNVVILTLGAIDSALFNSNFGTSVEMDLILTHFNPFLMISNQNWSEMLLF